MDDTYQVLGRLMRVIQQRKTASLETSYTARLLAGGAARVGAKILEEAAEVVEAAQEPERTGRGHLIRESADLLFHLMVLLACRDTAVEDVLAELARREGVSGLAEKASRRRNS